MANRPSTVTCIDLKSFAVVKVKIDCMDTRDGTIFIFINNSDENIHNYLFVMNFS